MYLCKISIKSPRATMSRFPSFPIRLEGTLNQMRLQWMNQEVQQDLKDHFFLGVCKHNRDLIQYLYRNPRTTYSQLRIAACMAESKHEGKPETRWEPGQQWPPKPVKGTTELGNQIARLMAALTRAGQDNSPSSAPNSPRQRGHGRGWMYRKHSWKPQLP